MGKIPPIVRIIGVFTAAFDDQIEWLIVKGIADYADGAESTTDSWSPFAGVMAASVVAHILRDPNVFRTWPHYQSKGNVRILIVCLIGVLVVL